MRQIYKESDLTEAELRRAQIGYQVQAKTQAARPPDRNGNRIQMLLSFDHWLEIWLASGQLLNRGRGAGKYCLGRIDDLGDYALGNVAILSWAENSRQSKLGRQSSLAGRVSPMRGRTHKEVTKEAQRASALARPTVTCPHCGRSGQRNAMARYHFDRCKHLGPCAPAGPDVGL